MLENEGEETDKFLSDEELDRSIKEYKCSLDDAVRKILEFEVEYGRLPSQEEMFTDLGLSGDQISMKLMQETLS